MAIIIGDDDLPGTLGSLSRLDASSAKSNLDVPVIVHGRPRGPARHLVVLLSLHRWLAKAMKIDSIDCKDKDHNAALLALAKKILRGE